MPRMTRDLKEYHNARDAEVEQLITLGWRVISEKEFQEVLHNKRKASLPIPPTSQVKHVNRANNH